MRKRILIINENVAEATNIKERLVSAYNDVECVTSIQDAVNRFVSTDFTLMILDANMSMEDDRKLLKVMRQAKRTPDIAVIIASRPFRATKGTLSRCACIYGASMLS